jgi:3-oxoacyl-[acyl-carrier protein] reductase
MKMIPANRAGKPEEVASLVSYLMSDAAAYITRQVISVNGGLC